MSILDKTLKKLKKSQEIAFFYRAHVDREVPCGFLIDYNEHCLCIHEVNLTGTSLGLVIFQRPQLQRIRWGSEELGAVHELYKRKNKGKKIKLPSIRIDSTRNALEDMHKAYGYISVNLVDHERDILLVGEIKSLDDTHVHLHEFSNKEYFDRTEIIFSIDDLTSIQGGGTYEEDIRYLNLEYWEKSKKTKKT